ncbi:MAG: 50S ribosomal protein L4 [Parcubacteria group bacterium]|nr:50S ribosomal protein L4 [Parcubacteria group bacterium]
MELSLYRADGSVVSSLEIPEKVLSVKISPRSLTQYVTAIRARERTAIASTLNRSEVRGGGRKPWPQKGTGRARAGSLRSPIFRGGGVVWGPRANRNFSKGLPDAMRHKALAGIFARRLLDKRVVVIDSLAAFTKTKEAEKTLSHLPLVRPILIVFHREEKDVTHAVRNLPRVRSSESATVNGYDFLLATTLLFSHKSFQSFLTRITNQ